MAKLREVFILSDVLLIIEERGARLIKDANLVVEDKNVEKFTLIILEKSKYLQISATKIYIFYYLKEYLHLM